MVHKEDCTLPIKPSCPQGPGTDNRYHLGGTDQAPFSQSRPPSNVGLEPSLPCSTLDIIHHLPAAQTCSLPSTHIRVDKGTDPGDTSKIVKGSFEQVPPQEQECAPLSNAAMCYAANTPALHS